MVFVTRLGTLLLIATLVFSLASSFARAQAVSVVVNGGAVSFDQPPVERTGRIFVPLRGVFERLGASVVYANGSINATGNGRNIHLTIGSTQATVDGQSVYMDVAPFLVGARTLVPLRFVAQSLGATVNWDASNSTVYINGAANAAAAPNSSAANAAAAPNGSAANFINSVNPASGSHVSGRFTLSGRTRPGSAVVVYVASTPSALHGAAHAFIARSRALTTADANGSFSVPVAINIVSGGSLRVTIGSTSPAGAHTQQAAFYST